VSRLEGVNIKMLGYLQREIERELILQVGCQGGAYAGKEGD